MQTRILVVDNHRIFCEGIRVLLQREKDFIVVGEAYDGRQAVKMAAELNPNAVVMDISMPELNGVDATRQILPAAPTVKVIALTAFGEQRQVSDALAVGMAGYVMKDALVEELVLSLRTAMQGKVYLSPSIAGGVVEHYVKGGQGPQAMAVKLTGREREVLQLTAEGKATKEVARCLDVSVKTAETHRRAIMEKLGMYSVAELTKYAIREGLTTIQ